MNHKENINQLCYEIKKTLNEYGNKRLQMEIVKRLAIKIELEAEDAIARE